MAGAMVAVQIRRVLWLHKPFDCNGTVDANPSKVVGSMVEVKTFEVWLQWWTHKSLKPRRLWAMADVNPSKVVRANSSNEGLVATMVDAQILRTSTVAPTTFEGFAYHCTHNLRTNS